MSAQQSVSQYPALYASLANSLPGQSLPWLQTFRAEAQAEFDRVGFPSLRAEEWRYTNVSALEKQIFTPVLQADMGALELEGLERYCLPDSWVIVLVDGHYAESLSRVQGLPDGVTVNALSALVTQQPEWLQRYLGQAVQNTEHGFVAFNSAWFSEGVVVHVPNNTHLSQTIQIVHVVTQADFMANTRHLIVVEESAQASVVETFIGCDQGYATAAVTEVFVQQNAQLTLVKVQEEGDKAYHFGGLYVQQARDSIFKHHNFALGSLVARTDVHSDLLQGSECHLNGLYIGQQRQHLDNHTRINHLQAHAISRELYKGVLNQRSRGVFQGRVVVAQQAQQTDSQMNNRNLLLSEHAEADTKPQLEIYADDVKCAHGVTVGQLDEKSIFYLQSRGVDEQTAKNMLTFAFANEMVDKLEITALREQLLSLVLARFPQAGIEQQWL